MDTRHGMLVVLFVVIAWLGGQLTDISLVRDSVLGTAISPNEVQLHGTVISPEEGQPWELTGTEISSNEVHLHGTVISLSDIQLQRIVLSSGLGLSVVTDEPLLVFRHCDTRPCCELFDTPHVLLCFRQSNIKYFFKPCSSSRKHVLLVWLLLMGGIEQNPGPTSASSSVLNLGLVNARSMVNKAALIHDVIKDNRLDMLAVTETWVYTDSPDVHKRDAAPDGYSVIHAHRDSSSDRGRKKQHGGGVALIHREDIRVKVVQRPIATPTTFELLLVKIMNSTRDLIIAIIYRPPNSTSNPAEFGNELSDLIDSGVVGSRFIICGDLNCPGPAGTKGVIGKELNELIDGYSLTQHVKSPTHRSGNILDHVLSPDGMALIDDVTVEDVGLSDHSLIKCKVAVNIKRQPIVRASFRNWKKLDLDMFSQRLRSSPVYQKPATTAQAFADQLEKDIVSILDELAPVCTSTKRQGKPESKWLSEDAVAAKRTRRRLERKWKSTGLEGVRVAYRAACRAANRMITESRRAFYARRVNESSRDPRALWRCVRGLLHTENHPISHEPGMSERFSDFFNDKIVKAKTKIAGLRAHLNPSLQPTQEDVIASDSCLHYLAETSVAEVSKLVAKLPNKSSPLDYLHTSVIKSCSKVISPLIVRLANLTFAEGYFPDQFKMAQVTPLIKKQGLDASDPSNYRPISNLNTISKVIERLCLARLLPHVAATGRFNPLQSAYRKFHSTETALLKIMDDLYRIVDDRKSAVLVGLDLSAAFDTIEHDILIDRLKTVFGIKDTALRWIETYLKERWQFVVAGGERSVKTLCKFGVPQGSVLGPFLFSVYVSPIAEVITSHGVQFHQYADDTQLYVAVKSDSDVEKLEKCTIAVRDWFTRNGMLLNPDKSEVLLVARKANAAKFAHGTGVCVAGTEIAHSVQLKSLGVTLDQNLSFDKHVADIVKLSNFNIRALRHIRPMLDRSVANTVACSIVSTRIDYCNSLLYGVSMKNIQRLQRTQNTLARVVSGVKMRDHIRPVLRDLHWLPVQQRIQYKVALITHKVLKTGQPQYLNSLVKEHKPTRQLRSEGQRLLTKPCGLLSALASRSFTRASESVWNSLPELVRKTDSLSTFKKLLKTHLFSCASWM